MRTVPQSEKVLAMVKAGNAAMYAAAESFPEPVTGGDVLSAVFTFTQMAINAVLEQCTEAQHRAATIAIARSVEQLNDAIITHVCPSTKVM